MPVVLPVLVAHAARARAVFLVLDRAHRSWAGLFVLASTCPRSYPLDPSCICSYARVPVPAAGCRHRPCPRSFLLVYAGAHLLALVRHLPVRAC